MQFDVDVVSRALDSFDGARSRGVARVDGTRAYFRGDAARKLRGHGSLEPS